MKFNHYIVIVVCLLFITCTEEFVGPKNDIVCNLMFDEHSKDNDFQSLIDNYTVDGFVGLTLLVDSPEEGLWIGSSGLANIEENEPMNPCHIHHTASLYKTFIATIILQLENEGKLNVEDKLFEYLNSEITDRLPNGNEISIKNLLQHRSGIPDIFEIDFILDFLNNQTKEYTIEELLEYVYDLEPLSAVDQEFYYSDANFSLLTLVIESIEGNIDDVLKSRIFQVLDLTETYFLADDQLPVGLSDSYWDRYGDGSIENYTDIQVILTRGLKGSDGVLSSANDLKTFIQAISNEELNVDLSQMTNFIDVPLSIQQTNVYSGYGMGLMRVNVSGEEWYGHFGNQIGSGSIVLYNEERDITLVALQNMGTFFNDDIKSKFFYQLIVDIEAILF